MNSSIPTEQFDGDMAVGRDITIGGNSAIRGSAKIGHNLIVNGWLEAKNIKSANKGLFKTEEQLRDAYPTPEKGWWALVAVQGSEATDHLGQLYISDGKKWVAQVDSSETPLLKGAPTIEHKEFMEAVEEMRASILNSERSRLQFEKANAPKFVPSKNLFNPNDIVSISIDGKGEIGRRNNWRGVYLPVQPGKKYSFSHSNTSYREGNVGRLAFCDGSKNVLSTINMDTLPSSKDGMGKTVTIPQGCYFVFKNIVVLDSDYTNTFQFEEGERVTDYEPFKALVTQIGGSPIRDLELERRLDEMGHPLSLSDIDTVPSKNLFNPNDIVSISIDNKGEIRRRNNWRGVYLPVQPGKKYSFSHSNTSYGEGNVGRLAFCDGSKNVLSTINMDTLPSSKDGMGKTVTIPQGCYFVFKNIVVLDSDYTNTFQFEEGERVTDYEPFKALVTQIGGSPIRDLELERRLDEMGHPLSLSDIDTVPPKNLFNPNDIVSISIDNKGEIRRHNNWRGVYLPVQPGKKYSFSHSNTSYREGNVGRLAFCDGSKNVLSTINMDTLPSSKDGMGKTVTIPQGCYFVFKNIVVLDSDYTNTFQFEEGERVTDYEPFKVLVKKIAGFDLGIAKAQDTRRYIDCEIVFFGDSITDQRMSKWWKALPSMLSFKNKVNYARSGATWSHTASTPYNITDLGGSTTANNVIWNQFNRMMSDISAGNISAPDVVVILAGTNDYSRPMGDVDRVFDWSVSYSNLEPTDERLQTVAGAIRYVCELLVKSFPTIRIILASPILRRDDNGNTMLLRNTILECAKRMSIGIIDQTLESGFSPFNLPNLLIDELHPNTDGGEVLARFLSGKIRSLL